MFHLAISLNSKKCLCSPAHPAGRRAGVLILVPLSQHLPSSPSLPLCNHVLVNNKPSISAKLASVTPQARVSQGYYLTRSSHFHPCRQHGLLKHDTDPDQTPGDGFPGRTSISKCREFLLLMTLTPKYYSHGEKPVRERLGGKGTQMYLLAQE